MNRLLLVGNISLTAAFVACLAIAATFHSDPKPISQRGDPGDAPSAQVSDFLTVSFLTVPAGDLVCLYIKNSDTPCVLEFHSANNRDPLKFGVFDHPSESVLPSPNQLHVLLIADKKAMVLSSDTLAVDFEKMAPQGYAFGTYDAFPSFHPKGRWISTTTIELSLYAANTPEPLDNAPSNSRPIPVSVEAFDVPTNRTR